MAGLRNITRFAGCVALAVVASMPLAASAATVTYTNSNATPQLQLVIDDGAVAGKFRFSLSTNVGTADYLGLGFDFAGTSIAQTDISLVSATRADGNAISPDLELFGNNTGSQSTCGNGCNFNGSGSASAFDYIIRIGDNGGSPNNYVMTVVFDIMTSGSLASNPFSQIAARAQSTSNPGGSIKADLCPAGSANCGPGVGVVPLPAGLPLLLSAFGVGAFVTRRNRKQA